MTVSFFRRAPVRITILSALALAVCVPDAIAQQPLERQPPPPAGRQTRDANETRSALMDLLQRHPPSVGRVLKLDPSLMRNEAYLSSYPALQEFLATYPDVPLNAGFYLEHVRGVSDPGTPPNPQLHVVQNMLEAMAVITGMVVVLGTLIWLLRTVVEQRRWNRLSKIQAEVHTKLMDRFSSNEELLAYVQMPAGRRFLESGPSPMQEMSPAIAIGAPFSRILWSVQIGAVLLVAGLGLLFLSGRALPEMREFFYIFGCMATALGAGFAVSALAAYVLSRRLGLLNPPPSAESHA